MIGARWKCSNTWSRSILIVPLPFYVLFTSVVACNNAGKEIDLTSNWCLQHQRRRSFLRHQSNDHAFVIKDIVERDLAHRASLCGTKRTKSPSSVPMAMRKHLFSFRTQKLSSSAAIILRKWETSTVPNYIKAIRIGWLLSFCGDCVYL